MDWDGDGDDDDDASRKRTVPAIDRYTLKRLFVQANVVPRVFRTPQVPYGLTERRWLDRFWAVFAGVTTFIAPYASRAAALDVQSRGYTDILRAHVYALVLLTERLTIRTNSTRNRSPFVNNPTNYSHHDFIAREHELSNVSFISLRLNLDPVEAIDDPQHRDTITLSIRTTDEYSHVHNPETQLDVCHVDVAFCKQWMEETPRSNQWDTSRYDDQEVCKIYDEHIELELSLVCGNNVKESMPATICIDDWNVYYDDEPADEWTKYWPRCIMLLNPSYMTLGGDMDEPPSSSTSIDVQATSSLIDNAMLRMPIIRDWFREHVRLFVNMG